MQTTKYCCLFAPVLRVHAICIEGTVPYKPDLTMFSPLRDLMAVLSGANFYVAQWTACSPFVSRFSLEITLFGSKQSIMSMLDTKQEN